MTLLDELIIFWKGILYWVYVFVATAFFVFAFGPGEVFFMGKTYFLPIFNVNSFSIMFFNKVRIDLLPPDVELVVTNPMSAFVSQVLLSAFLSFLITLPYFLYKLIVYLSPALLPREKKAVIWIILPLIFLFMCGSAFSYYIIVPTTFRMFYPYATLIGAVAYFSLDEFISYVFSLMMAVGVMFLLPMFMILLSYIGIIKSRYWKSKWRHAVLLFLIVSAIITPDGTGVTMLMLFLPMMLLYYFGYHFSKKLE